MDEGCCAVSGSEVAGEEGVHGYGVAGAVAERVVVAEGEVVEVELAFCAGGEDGDDAGEIPWVRGGRGGGEEREEVSCEARARVVM